MHSHNSHESALVRSVLTIFVFLSISIGMVMNLVADELGYVSTNPSDLPPNLTRNISLRSVDPDLPPAYGPEDAKVLIITFADFMCPACRRASQATHQIAAEFPGEVRVEYWNHPLMGIHPDSEQAAAAAIAAQRQGKFWEMHDLLFKTPKHDMATLEGNARALDLDMTQFMSDMSDPLVREQIREEGALADALGATSTPGFFVNGKMYMGWASWNNFRRIVERELKIVNSLAEQGMGSFEIQNQRAIDNNVDSETYELYRLNFIEPRFAKAGY